MSLCGNSILLKISFRPVLNCKELYFGSKQRSFVILFGNGKCCDKRNNDQRAYKLSKGYHPWSILLQQFNWKWLHGLKNNKQHKQQHYLLWWVVFPLNVTLQEIQHFWKSPEIAENSDFGLTMEAYENFSFLVIQPPLLHVSNKFLHKKPVS